MEHSPEDMNFSAEDQSEFSPEVQKIAASLREKNKDYLRTKLPDGRLEIRDNEGNIFYLEQVREAESREVHEIQDLMERTFNPEEIDPIEVTNKCLEKLDDPGRRADYLLQVLKNADGKVIGVMNAAYIPVRSESGQDKGYGVSSVGYVVIDKEYQKKGLGREFYADLYERSDQSARQRGEQFKLVVGESVPTVEATLNSLGDRGRVYIQKGPNEFEEVKYYQPPLEFDKDTGKPVEGAGVSPEHFMVGTLNQDRTITTEELKDSVRSVYEYNNVLAAVDSMDGYENMWEKGRLKDNAKKNLEISSLRLIKDIYDKLSAQLQRSDEVRIISKQEREAMMARGVKFDEHTEADEKFWSEEGIG